MRRNVLNITASDVKDAKLTATVTIPAADVDAAIKKLTRHRQEVPLPGLPRR